MAFISRFHGVLLQFRHGDLEAEPFLINGLNKDQRIRRAERFDLFQAREQVHKSDNAEA
jgi:hypothetical protein